MYYTKADNIDNVASSLSTKEGKIKVSMCFLCLTVRLSVCVISLFLSLFLCFIFAYLSFLCGFVICLFLLSFFL